MKTKFIALSLIVAGICIASCRQDDENPAEETIQSSLKQDSTEEFQKNGSRKFGNRSSKRWSTLESR